MNRLKKFKSNKIFFIYRFISFLASLFRSKYILNKILFIDSKDPNQLIRASALRVLSSIRVPIITTIMLLAIKEAVSDMSPYVRKTAANAITKLYNLDPDLKDELIEIIEKLLADKTIVHNYVLFHQYFNYHFFLN